jgi:hypothetical protein
MTNKAEAIVGLAEAVESLRGEPMKAVEGPEQFAHTKNPRLYSVRCRIPLSQQQPEPGRIGSPWHEGHQRTSHRHDTVSATHQAPEATASRQPDRQAPWYSPWHQRAWYWPSDLA